MPTVLPQLYYYSFAGHSARLLSSGTGRHGSPLWSPDGQHVVFTGTERDGATTDIYMSDLGRRRRAAPGGGRP